MERIEIKELSETAARVGAVTLTVLYVLGFLVVAFQDASRGIVAFTFFRAKVLAAGISFSIFALFPVLGWTRLLPEKSRADTERVPPTALGLYVSVRKLTFFFMVAVGIGWLSSLYLFQTRPSGRYALFYLVLAAAFAAVTVFCDPRAASHPKACAAFLLLVLLVGIAALLFLVRNRSAELIVAWFVVVGFQAHYLRKELREAPDLTFVNWHWVLVYTFVAIWFFASYFYPLLSPKFGGGKPIHATVQFFNPSPIDRAAKDDLWLLDEVDSGYYVLRHPNESRAIFLPRSLVSAIYFAAE